jgi:hypothetical protein
MSAQARRPPDPAGEPQAVTTTSKMATTGNARTAIRRYKAPEGCSGHYGEGDGLADPVDDDVVEGGADVMLILVEVTTVVSVRVVDVGEGRT